MLVLTRKKLESIDIGGLNDSQPMITVTVLEICGGRVRLGFNGDPTVFIHRSELWERIRTRGAPAERKRRGRGASRMTRLVITDHFRRRETGTGSSLRRCANTSRQPEMKRICAVWVREPD